MTPTKDQQAQEYAENKNRALRKAWFEYRFGEIRDGDDWENDPVKPSDNFEKGFLKGYTAAEQAMTDGEATVIQGWVACDKGGMVRLHYTEPKRTDGGYWQGAFKSTYLPKGKFPSLTWSDEPLEVELTIKPKNR